MDINGNIGFWINWKSLAIFMKILNCYDRSRKKSLRLWAWSQAPRSDKPTQTHENYDCELLCRGQEDQRKLHRCTRVDLPEVEWPEGNPSMPRPHLGRNRLIVIREQKMMYQGHTVKSWQYPPEDWGNGCPGGWYRTPFIASIWKYIRSRDEIGGWNDNEFLRDTNNALVKAACRYYETYVENRHSYQNHLINAENALAVAAAKAKRA